MVTLILSPLGLAQENKNFSVSSDATPVANQDEITDLEGVIEQMNGVEGYYPSNIPLGCAALARCGLDRNWFPLSNTTQIACGTLSSFHTHAGKFLQLGSCANEMDWNIGIHLSDRYAYLNGIAATIANGEMPFEAEVTPDETFFGNRWFRKDATSSILQDQNICVRGPWVRDEDHQEWWPQGRGAKLEIHPSQLIWWKSTTPVAYVNNYYLLVVQDDSDRFDGLSDFDCGGYGDNLPAGFEPWSRAPISARFRVPFVVNPAVLLLPIRIKLSSPHYRHVVTSGKPESADADDGKQHILEYDGKRLVFVDEGIGQDDDIGVQFVDIRKRGNGFVQGYVQISSVVGRNDISDKGGYHLIVAEVRSNTRFIPLPDLCRKERTNVRNLRRALPGIEESIAELQSALRTAPASHRAQIQREITDLRSQAAQLREQIGTAEQLLSQCQNEPPSRR